MILFSPIFIQPSISHSIVDISLPSTHYIYIIEGGEGGGTLWTSISKLLQEIESTIDLLDNPLPTERFKQYAKKVCLYRVVVLANVGWVLENDWKPDRVIN